MKNKTEQDIWLPLKMVLGVVLKYVGSIALSLLLLWILAAGFVYSSIYGTWGWGLAFVPVPLMYLVTRYVVIRMLDGIVYRLCGNYLGVVRNIMLRMSLYVLVTLLVLFKLGIAKIPPFSDIYSIFIWLGLVDKIPSGITAYDIAYCGVWELLALIFVIAGLLAGLGIKTIRKEKNHE